MKLLKITILALILIVGIVGNYFYHKIVFSYLKFKESYPNINLNIKNDYYTYFFKHDPTPLYTFKNDILTKYQKYSFLNKKSGLIFPHQETVADLEYISDIQYLASFKKVYEAKQIYEELNYVTNLSPYRPWIYNLGLLIIPVGTKEDKKLTFLQKLSIRKQTVNLWEKWIFFNCDSKKIKNILDLPDDRYFHYAYSKTWEFFNQNKNPCNDLELPQNLWFDYYYYLRDLPNTVKYYKVAGFFDESLPWIIWMVAVVNWMLWEHEKSMYLMLTKASSLYEKLKNTENSKEASFIEENLNNTIKRAQAELNFYIVTQADQKHPECDKQYDCLVKKGYVKQEIENMLSYCQKYFDFNKIKSFKDLFSKNINLSIQNAKCFLLWLNIQSWYIKNNQLHTVFRENWTYYWDEDLQTWWEK